MIKMGYQGVPGANSEEATLSFYSDLGSERVLDAIGYQSFGSLIQDLVTRQLDYAVIPVENSTTGLITRTLDLLRDIPVVAVSELYQPIQHVLWGTAEASLDTIDTVYSHPEALSQCSQFLDSHTGWSQIAYADTAEAAKFIKMENNPALAAVASGRAGNLYGLTPLAREFQNEQHNTTRFFLMEHYQTIQDLSGNRLVLYIETLHEAGSLLDLLEVFDLFKINLESLNSQPIPKKPFAYGFYVEIDLATLEGEFDLLWQMVEHVSENIHIIGQFESTSTR